MLKFAVAALAAATLLPSAHAQDAALTARMDEVARSYMRNNGYMGSVLVVRGDEVLIDKSYGSANLDWNIPNAPDVKFRLGSLTKQFTAALILLMQQDGKLNIADPVSKYLPDAPATWSKITVNELLNHTSGIPNFTSDPTFPVWSASPRTPAEELAYFSAKPLDFEPSSKYSYSNSNFEVLGIILEKVSRKSYNDLLQERLFVPLGMHDSGLDADNLILPKRALGYSNDNGKLVYARSESLTVPWAAGSLYSTTGDLLIWEHALFGGKVLSPASLTAMTTPGKGHYALGIEAITLDGLKVVQHDGGIEGFTTHMAYVPEKRIAVIVLSNVATVAPPEMGAQLLDLALGKSVEIKAERKAVPIAPAELTKFAGVYDLTPSLALTFSVKEGVLYASVGPQTFSLMYQGVRNGHQYFFLSAANIDIEFIPDSTGAITSMLWMQKGAETQTGKRRP